MTKHIGLNVDTKIKRVFKATASVLLIAVMTFAMMIPSSDFAFADTVDRAANELWAITIGDEEVLYVDSEESGRQVIEGLKNYYLTEGATVLDVQFDPEIRVEKIEAAKDEEFAAQNSLVEVEDAIAQLSDGKTEYYVYRTVEGDSLESIAKEKKISAKKLVSLNFGEYDADETIKEGTYLVLYGEVPYVKVTTVEEMTTAVAIDYKTVYKKSASMKKGTRKVQTKGVKGKKNVTAQVTKVNGETVENTVLSSEVVKEPTNKVVLKGSGSVTAKKGVTYDFAEGADVVEYAKKFVGNPYRYGGTSLTDGADCSGFVYSVYKNMGVNMPRVGQIGVGKSVSLSNLKKGDILFYSGHVAIYAGNGKAVHAVNERMGIRVTSMYYTGTPYAARRIFD